jgi:Ca-activated chloride channel homolog
MQRILATVLTVAALVHLLLFAATQSAAAADAPHAMPQTMLVIDGSGSMWGRFEGGDLAKIDAARDLLKSKIEAATGQPVGLTSFGHRRKGDCSDVEVIAAPTADHDAMLGTLAKLNPRGKGPLVAGLRQAVAALGKSRPASLIVVNDGADNCQQDACAAAAEIATANPGVPVHMIGIGIDAVDIPQVQCVSKATGGTFYDVKDAIGLATAIEEATQLAMLAPGAKPVAQSGNRSNTQPGNPSGNQPGGATPPLPPTATAGSVQASVTLAAGGAALSLPMHWRIVKDHATDPIAEATGPSITANLDPGTYDIDAEIGAIRVKQSITIEAGRAAGIIVPLNAGRLKIAVKNEKAAQVPSSLFVSIEPVLDGKPLADAALIERRLPDPQILAPGTYVVSIADGALRQSKTVSLSPGSDTVVEFTTATGRVELSAGLREDGGAIEDVSYIISEDDPDSADGRREVARSRSPTAAFTLAPGTYYATARSGDGEVRQRIAVGPGDVIKRALILPLVAVKVTALIGGQPATASQGIVYSVTALDGERREITRSVLPELALSLMPGRYRIAAQLDAHHLKAAEEITVEAGKSLNVVLKFDAGEISLKVGSSAPLGAGDTYWEIVDAAGKPVWRSMTSDAKALLAPGRYTVHLETRDKRTEAAFEIHSGEHKVVQVGQN